jgi:hypothetical protein
LGVQNIALAKDPDNKTHTRTLSASIKGGATKTGSAQDQERGINYQADKACSQN